MAREVDVEKMLELPWERQNWRETCLCREAPRDLIAAIGSGYQRMFYRSVDERDRCQARAR